MDLYVYALWDIKKREIGLTMLLRPHRVRLSGCNHYFLKTYIRYFNHLGILLYFDVVTLIFMHKSPTFGKKNLLIYLQ